MRPLVVALMAPLACARPPAPAPHAAAPPAGGITSEIGPPQGARCDGRVVEYKELPTRPGEDFVWFRAGCTIDVSPYYAPDLDYLYIDPTWRFEDPQVKERETQCMDEAWRRLKSPRWREREAWCMSEARRTERTITLRERRPIACVRELKIECQVFLRPRIETETWTKRAPEDPPSETGYGPSEDKATTESWTRLSHMLEDPVWRTGNGACSTAATEGTGGKRSLEIRDGKDVRRISCGQQTPPAAWLKLEAALNDLSKPPPDDEPEPEP